MSEILQINKKSKVNKFDIVFLEAISNYTCIHTIEKQVVSSITLKEVIKRIGSSNFLKINRGLSINKMFIHQVNLDVDNAYILMKNNKKLPISRRRLLYVIENIA